MGASGVCQMYSDAGLIGALVVSEAASAGKAISAVVSALRSASVTEEQVAGAEKQLLSDVYTLMEDPLQLVENMGVQVLVSGDVMPVEKYPEIIAGNVAASGVCQMYSDAGLIGALVVSEAASAGKAISAVVSASKLAMGAVGNLSSVPHLD